MAKERKKEADLRCLLDFSGFMKTMFSRLYIYYLQFTEVRKNGSKDEIKENG